MRRITIVDVVGLLAAVGLAGLPPRVSARSLADSSVPFTLDLRFRRQSFSFALP